MHDLFKLNNVFVFNYILGFMNFKPSMILTRAVLEHSSNYNMT